MLLPPVSILPTFRMCMDSLSVWCCTNEAGWTCGSDSSLCIYMPSMRHHSHCPHKLTSITRALPPPPPHNLTFTTRALILHTILHPPPGLSPSTQSYIHHQGSHPPYNLTSTTRALTLHTILHPPPGLSPPVHSYLTCTLLDNLTCVIKATLIYNQCFKLSTLKWVHVCIIAP